MVNPNRKQAANLPQTEQKVRNVFDLSNSMEMTKSQHESFIDPILKSTHENLIDQREESKESNLIYYGKNDQVHKIL